MNGEFIFQSHLPGTLSPLLRAVRSPRYSIPTITSDGDLNPRSPGVNSVPWCHSHLTEPTRHHALSPWHKSLYRSPPVSTLLVITISRPPCCPTAAPQGTALSSPALMAGREPLSSLERLEWEWFKADGQGLVFYLDHLLRLLALKRKGVSGPFPTPQPQLRRPPRLQWAPGHIYVMAAFATQGVCDTLW